MFVKTVLFISLIILAYSSEGSATSNCTCVPYERCNSKEIAGVGLLDLRKLKKNCRENEVCCENSLIQPPAKVESHRLGCGYHKNDDRSYPWAVNLIVKRNNTKMYKCDGSLINRKAILTSANCFNTSGIWFAKFGNTMRHVSRIIVHPSTDLALVLLVRVAPNVRRHAPVCLPPASTDDKWAKQDCIAVLPLVPGGTTLLCPLAKQQPQQDDRLQLEAIGSWNSKNKDRILQALYHVRPAEHRAWIDKQMEKYDLGTQSYTY